MEIDEETFYQLLNEIDELKNKQVDSDINKINFNELKSNTVYIIEFSKDIDINAMCNYMQKIIECTKEFNNRYIVSSPKFKIKEANSSEN